MIHKLLILVTAVSSLIGCSDDREKFTDYTEDEVMSVVRMHIEGAADCAYLGSKTKKRTYLSERNSVLNTREAFLRNTTDCIVDLGYQVVKCDKEEIQHLKMKDHYAGLSSYQTKRLRECIRGRGDEDVQRKIPLRELQGLRDLTGLVKELKDFNPNKDL